MIDTTTVIDTTTADTTIPPTTIVNDTTTADTTIPPTTITTSATTDTTMQTNTTTEDENNYGEHINCNRLVISFLMMILVIIIYK